MFKIVRKKQLNEQVVLLELEAPFIAAKAEAGQFIIFRLDENGERVPLTISDYDREMGTLYYLFTDSLFCVYVESSPFIES